jgi:hypothetical protein
MDQHDADAKAKLEKEAATAKTASDNATKKVATETVSAAATVTNAVSTK